ncbi:MAG: hypothetical protein AAGJ08_08805 [Cyanobacteria bacterium P01_H01_bin.35]
MWERILSANPIRVQMLRCVCLAILRSRRLAYGDTIFLLNGSTN